MYISKEQIKRHKIISHYPNEYEEGWNDAIDEILEDQPCAVQEVKHGKWLLEKEPDGKPYCFHCSVCDSDFSRISIQSATPFCPWCGAKMEGVKE